MQGFRYFNDSYLNYLLSSAKMIVFDMNGLIIDDETVQLKSVNQTLEALHLRISEDCWTANCVGKRADEYFSSILSKNNINHDASFISDLVKQKNRRYHKLIAFKVKDLVRPGVLELLQFVFQCKSKKLALATSALESEIDSIVGKKGLDILHEFHFVVCGSEVEKSKPDPEIYHILTKRSGISPALCLVFEDSGLGVNAAYAAGIRCIAVPNRFTASHKFEKALCTVDNLTPRAVILSGIEHNSQERETR